jgi:hypothetical protein
VDLDHRTADRKILAPSTERAPFDDPDALHEPPDSHTASGEKS